MRILILSQFHMLPGSGSGTPRTTELARFWALMGHEVRVLAGTLDHGTETVPPRYRGRFTTRESEPGVEVTRTYTLGASKTTAVGRIARDLSFTLSSGVAGALSRWRPDIVVGSSPPLTTMVSAAALARFHDAPLVFDMRDLWPDYALETGALRGRAAATALALEGALYRASDHIVAVTPSFTDVLARKGVPRDKVAYIPNGVDTDLFRRGPPDDELRRQLGWEGRTVACYAGVHGPAQALDQLLDAAAHLRDRPDILIALFGDGEERPKLERRVKEEGLDNVQFCGTVPRAQIPRILRTADTALAPLRSLPSFARVYPSKLLEAMACGAPIVFAGEGAAAELVQKAGAGIVVPPEAPDELARALVQLSADRRAREEMSARGASFVREQHDRRALASQYAALLEQIVR